MYKIMLAEDEPEVLGAILSIIDWQNYHFEQPMGCRDGKEAIAALEGGFVPDVLITDICMPFVDGLELTRYMAVNCPKAVVVILSGYDDFQYAQQAVQLKAYDYVLKPVTPASMNSLLKRLTEELDNRRLGDIEDSMGILANHFLNRLTTRRLDDALVEENLRRHQLRLDGGFHLAMVMDMDSLSAMDGEAGSNLEIMRYALYNIAEELIAASHPLPVFQAQDGTTRLIVSAPTPEECRDIAGAIAATVTAAIRETLPGTALVGIGEPVSAIGAVYRSHRQAAEALAHRFFRGESSILFFGSIGERESPQADLSAHYRAFDAALRSFSKDSSCQAVSALFLQLKNGHWAMDRCILCCQRLILLLHEFVGQFGGEEELRRLETLWQETDYRTAATIGQLEELTHRIVGRVLDQFEPIQADSAAAQVRKAENYILAHYGDADLSLQSITEYLAISVSYFSSIFKSRTGSTFVEYLTRVRMDKAKQLLALTDRRTYETAEAVGFVDPHYFSVAFKRYTGMSPREYREYSRRQVR